MAYHCFVDSLKYFIIYKPFGILSQFSDEGKRQGLGAVFNIPKDVYPVGRLDADSEGLLILTNDKSLNNRLLNPRNRHNRTYWIQVEGAPTSDDLKVFNSPMRLNYKGKIHTTMPAESHLLDVIPELPERDPPVRFRANIPTTWISLTLQEGKNRQVRKMTAQAGFPTLRLVRWSIESLTIEGFKSGEMRSVDRHTIEKLLFEDRN